mgnify:CR=1 FL=1
MWDLGTLLVRPVGRTYGGGVTFGGTSRCPRAGCAAARRRGAICCRAARPRQRLRMPSREGLDRLGEGQVHLFSPEQPTPQETARRLIPGREPRLPRQDRLQVDRSHPQVRGEPRHAESGLGQKLGKIKARHAPLPRTLFRRRCDAGAHSDGGPVNTNPRRSAGGDRHRPGFSVPRRQASSSAFFGLRPRWDIAPGRTPGGAPRAGRGIRPFALTLCSETG